MKGHIAIEKQLAIYRSLNAGEQRAVDAHVRTCGICAARQTAYTDMDGALARLQDLRPPARLSRALDAIVRGEKPARRDLGQASSRPLWPRRIFVPVGLALLLILGVWLVAQLVTPLRHQIAETPSVTPTATPLALVSPTLRQATSDAVAWRGTQPPDQATSPATAGAHVPTAALAATQLTPAAFVRALPLSPGANLR
jgi:hypothetical protein